MTTTMAQDVSDPNVIVARDDGGEQLYRRIMRAAQRAGIYGDQAGDVAAETWIIARGHGYYDPRMIRKAARNLGLWRTAQGGDRDDAMAARDDDTHVRQTDARARVIEIAAGTTDPRLLGVIRDVLEAGQAGEDIHIVALAARYGLSYCQLRRLGRQAAERRDQLPLLSEVGIAA